MYEIERRFVARLDRSEVLEGAPVQRLEQGYLSAQEPAVRIRLEAGRYVLAVKSGRGLVRREIEAPLPDEAGAALLELAGTRRLAKRRYRLGRWELDVFEGALAGLTLAEIELRAEDEPLPPPPPGVRLLREVTEDGRYTNQALAGLAPTEAAALVAASG